MARPDWYCDDVLSRDLDVQRVFEDEQVLAFRHPGPSAPVHVVVVPKEHVSSLLDPEALDVRRQAVHPAASCRSRY